MAQSVFLPRTNLPTFTPQSPDPTPLRTIAFSVAESALQSDPNSPALDSLAYTGPRPFIRGQWLDQWTVEDLENVPVPLDPHYGGKRAGEGRKLMNVVERAKERRERENLPPLRTKSSYPAPASPPLSPSYNFVLPSNSPLAASIAATPRQNESHFTQRTDIPTPPSALRRTNVAPTPPPNVTRPRPPILTVTPPSKKTVPLYTRSVEPSPTRPMFGVQSPTALTFASMDKRNPPPDFVPRLSATELSARLGLNESARTRRDPTGESQLAVARPHRTLVKLPSLAQIQAKVSKTEDDAQRAANRMVIPPTQGVQGQGDSRAPRFPMATPWKSYRNDSQGSLEILQTPTDELPPLTQPMVSALSRPATPPSPTLQQMGKDSPGLAMFLRQRTSGRLNRSRPLSMPPLAAGESLNFDAFLPPKASLPLPTRSNSTSPTRPFLALTENRLHQTIANRRSVFIGGDIATPPHRSMSLTPSLISPTDSTRSYRSSSSGSPTLPVPMITCTPAPVRMLKDGVEQDSDEEEGDVVLFEREDEWSDDVDEEQVEDIQREQLARMMKAKLGLRRPSQ
ncbi:hypothetical protein BD324DRAFT_650926 [Kockovaella imperatae]|uniref:Uncharacterized protein n=1 Tax=Kockovaella imperatae TaxID=4999 RepID=A0A1Y1UIK2_9TREE|nr:hypothetical protein BD324DRAFT_650926 [Kockovaella imperatae]ORX37326.1 hypothetical protein BD324DRAFT_650926 [Kockovaella imperatae]